MKWDDRREKLFEDANPNELDNLIRSGTWKIVCIDDAPKNTKILDGRFVLAIKDDGTNKKSGKLFL